MKHSITVGIVLLSVTTNAFAECIAVGTYGKIAENPIYKILICEPAETVVKELAEKSPDDLVDYSGLQFSEKHSALLITSASSDGIVLMFQNPEYWYYAGECGVLKFVTYLHDPVLETTCCDLGPTRSLPCALGGGFRNTLVSF